MKTILRFTMIPLIALLGLVFGCNSHASFDSETCGNERLDDGEECDSTPGGIATFNGKDTCQALGFIGGNLKCTSGCKIDTTNCIPGNEDCHPIFDTGCDDGTNCFYFPTGDQTQCGDFGTAGEGQWCGTPFDCGVRMTCFDDGDGLGPLCRRVCQPGGECPAEQVCMGGYNWLNDTLGICPLGPAACDPLLDTGCTEEHCYLLDYYDTVGCAPGSMAPEGSPCDQNLDCSPKHACVPLEPSGSSVCTRLCSPSQPCMNAFEVCAFYENSPAGFCVTGTDCEPGTPAGCDEAKYCYVVNSHYERACLPNGYVGSEEGCCLFNRCMDGMYCDMSGDKLCHQICTTSAECPGGSCLYPTEWNTPYGVCE